MRARYVVKKYLWNVLWANYDFILLFICSYFLIDLFSTGRQEHFKESINQINDNILATFKFHLPNQFKFNSIPQKA